MKIKNFGILAGLGFVFSIPVGFTARAQKAQNLNEVVIAATKSDQKKNQSGKVITVIDKALLELNQGKNLAELLNHQAGITVVGSGSNLGKEKGVFLRGAAGSYTIILIDGIIANDPSGVGGAFDLRLFNIDQIERIEIIKGGQSVLYGSEAVAGVINIITKKSAQKVLQGDLVVGAGSYQTFKTDLGLRGSTGLFNYQLNYGVFNTEGISEASVPVDQNVSNFDNDGTKLNVLNASLGIQLNPKIIIRPFLKWNKGNFDYDANAFSDAAYSASSNHINTGVQATYELQKGKLQLNYSHQNTERIYKSDFPGVYDGTLNFLDIYYKHKITNKIDVLVGYDQRTTKVLYEDEAKPSANLYSGYVNAFIHDLGKFNLEVGYRFNEHSTYGNNSTYSITPSFAISNHLKLFGTVSTAFRAPTLDMLFGRYGANMNLKPETSENYELGLNAEIIADKLTLNISTFKRNLDEAIIYGAEGYLNQDQQNDKGFEVEPSLQFKTFRFNAYYAYVTGTSISGTVEKDFLIRRPKHSFGFNSSFQANDKLTFSLNYKYTGKRVDSDFSTWPAQNVDLKAFNLVDFYVQYKVFKQKLNLFVDVKNLTNAKYTEIVGFNTMGTNFMTGLNYAF
ncbi:MAG: TonB-dependent receptor [Pedobacter sp.]|nr:MAG: TonB-dependent receptor [Pedobacter sp.]